MSESEYEPVSWRPRPDPALQHPLPLGMRPHRHRPNRVYGWVILQHQVWVDYWGNEHDIEVMPADYVTNVIGFCQLRADRIRLIVAAELAYRAMLRALTGQPGLAVPFELLSFAQPSIIWLNSTPLICALERRSPTLTGE